MGSIPSSAATPRKVSEESRWVTQPGRGNHLSLSKSLEGGSMNNIVWILLVVFLILGIIFFARRT